MNRLSAFYNILRGLLRNIVDSPTTNVYFDLLNAVAQDRFVSLIEPIRDHLMELNRLPRREEIFENFNSLNESIEEFNSNFSNYPNLRIEQIRKTVIICRRVASIANKIKIDPSNYVLIPLDNKIKPNNYWIYGTSISNSALIFSINQTTEKENEDFQQFIDGIPDGQIQILFHFLIKLGSRRELDKEQYILVNKRYKKQTSKIVALLKLSSVCDGQVVHAPFTVNRNPQIISRANLGLQNSYQQFNDSIHILSEYNHEKDILNKYLRIYHVIENFMFKTPIVEMMSTTGGRMFSIRNFKNLYAKVEKQEMAALTEFINTVFNIEKIPGRTFKQSVILLWNSLNALPDFNVPQIDTLLSDLKISFRTANPANNGNILDFYCNLIYQLRNSIVHNKETEFHILHSTLNPIIPFLMTNFLFPSLEEICFKLIIESNVKVTYTQPNLQLFEV